MTPEPYSEEVLSLFGSPRHVGDVEGPYTAYAASTDVRIRLSAECDGPRLVTLRFKARGCPHVIAGAEWLCREYAGRPGTALLDFSAADLMQSLSVPVEKTGRILVLEEAAQALGKLCGNVQ